MNTENLTKSLEFLLAHNIVNFTYFKVDGTIRRARGTRNLCLACKTLGISIPTPKTGKDNPTAYFDLDKGAWRSFVADNLISIDKIENGVRTIDVKNMRKNEPEKGSNFGGGFGGGKDVVEIPIGDSFDIDKIAKALGVSGKVSTPAYQPQGVALPIDGMSIDDFAKLVAKYVVAELADRLRHI